MPFVSFTVGVLAKTSAIPVSKSVLEATIEGLQDRCAETASEMQCPCHQRNARVIVDGEKLDHLEIEIVCCCDRFANRLRDTLQKSLDQG
jgi:hypothetical protein